MLHRYYIFPGYGIYIVVLQQQNKTEMREVHTRYNIEVFNIRIFMNVRSTCKPTL